MDSEHLIPLALCSGRICAMKNFIARFVTDQSGAVDFEDGLTVVSLIVGFICAIGLMHSTVVQLYASIFGMLPS
jgi:Flp pilus assembly pilin Flp